MTDEEYHVFDETKNRDDVFVRPRTPWALRLAMYPSESTDGSKRTTKYLVYRYDASKAFIAQFLSRTMDSRSIKVYTNTQTKTTVDKRYADVPEYEAVRRAMERLERRNMLDVSVFRPQRRSSVCLFRPKCVKTQECVYCLLEAMNNRTNTRRGLRAVKDTDIGHVDSGFLERRVTETASRIITQKSYSSSRRRSRSRSSSSSSSSASSTTSTSSSSSSSSSGEDVDVKQKTDPDEQRRSTSPSPAQPSTQKQEVKHKDGGCRKRKRTVEVMGVVKTAKVVLTRLDDDLFGEQHDETKTCPESDGKAEGHAPKTTTTASPGRTSASESGRAPKRKGPASTDHGRRNKLPKSPGPATSEVSSKSSATGAGGDRPNEQHHDNRTPPATAVETQPREPSNSSSAAKTTSVERQEVTSDALLPETRPTSSETDTSSESDDADDDDDDDDSMTSSIEDDGNWRRR